MKTFGKILVALGAVGAVVAGAVVAAPGLRIRKTRANAEAEGKDTANAAPAVADASHRAASEAAGVMFVGAVDEVELGPVDVVDVFDPAEVPSEHPEINELRTKMPLG